MSTSTSTKNTETPLHFVEAFWGEIAPCEHLVQIYNEDAAFLDSLFGFVAGGLKIGEGVIVIATSVHLKSLENRLAAAGVDFETAAAFNQYIALDAKETLSQFMVNGWPDDKLFSKAVGSLLLRAGQNGRRVRAFGEMVALLWAEGHNGATVRLEHLWHEICRKEAFSLFCAYPRTGFTTNPDAAIKEICEAHSRVIAA
jgi:hypothetical protein